MGDTPRLDCLAAMSGGIFDCCKPKKVQESPEEDSSYLFGTPEERDEWGPCPGYIHVLNLRLNQFLILVTAVALVIPLIILNHESPYAPKFYQADGVEGIPDATRFMLIVFLVYEHLYDLPLTILVLLQASKRCCAGAPVFVPLYNVTHFLTPVAYVSAFTISVIPETGWTFWREHKYGDSYLYPIYYGAALIVQLIVRVILVKHVQPWLLKKDDDERKALLPSANTRSRW